MSQKFTHFSSIYDLTREVSLPIKDKLPCPNMPMIIRRFPCISPSFLSPREPPLEVPTPRPEPFATSTVSVAELQGLERRLGSLESQVKGLRRAVLQQAGGGGGGGRRSEGSRVWYALTFAGWLMVPLVVVFMFHYRKTA